MWLWLLLHYSPYPRGLIQKSEAAIDTPSLHFPFPFLFLPVQLFFLFWTAWPCIVLFLPFFFFCCLSPLLTSTRVPPQVRQFSPNPSPTFPSPCPSKLYIKLPFAFSFSRSHSVGGSFFCCCAGWLATVLMSCHSFIRRPDHLIAGKRGKETSSLSVSVITDQSIPDPSTTLHTNLPLFSDGAFPSRLLPQSDQVSVFTIIIIITAAAATVLYQNTTLDDTISGYSI